MSHHFEAIGFDLNGVVVGNAVPHMLDYLHIGLKVPLDKLKEVVDKYTVPLDRGDITDREFWQKVNQELGIHADIQVEEEYRFGHYLKDAPVRKRILDLAERLRSNGYKVGLLSNSSAEGVALNRPRHIFEHFDVVVMSNLVGAVKPDAEAYQALLDELHVSEPSSLIFIDDLVENVVGAQGLGIYGMKFVGYSILLRELAELGVRV